MQTTYGGRPTGPGPLPVRTPSYEIKVTREVSVDSRPESRKKMHYTTFPPNAASKPKTYNAITQARVSAESNNPKAFADFSFSNSNDVESIQNTLTGGGMRNRGSTLDLAQFLKTTSPPQSRGPSPTPPSRSSSVAKRIGRGLFRSSGSRSARSTPAPEQDRPMRLPDSVVSRTATNGSKYLLISVPTSLDSTVEEPPVPPKDAPARHEPSYNPTDTYHHPPPVDALMPPPSLGTMTRPSRSGTMETEGSAVSAFRPYVAVKETPKDNAPPTRSIQPSPALDEEVASTYHSFLKSQTPPAPRKEEPIRETPSREGQATRPTTANSFRDDKGHKSRFSMGSDDEVAPGKHSRQLSVISDAPSYKSVSIHRDGVPSRTSSAKPAVPVVNDGPGPILGNAPPNSLASTLAGHAHSGRPSSQGQIQTHAQAPVANRLPLPHTDFNRHSHASTTGSTADSVGASSDASSGIVMDAQVVRSAGNAGYYNSNARKPPRPGPAPTRALPSLPETRDDSGILKHRRSQGAMKPEIVHPTLTIPERQTIIESPVVSSFVEATSKPMFDPPSRTNTMDSTISKATADPRQRASDRRALTPSPGPANDALRVARKSREERVRARKMRDLQSIRARHENAKLDGDSLSPKPKPEREASLRTRSPQPMSDREGSLRARNSLVSQASTFTDSSSGGSTTTRSSFRLSGTGSATSPNHRLSATGSIPAPLRRLSRSRRQQKNNVSPIMLVMEQEPASGLFHASSSGMSPLVRRKRSTVSANSAPTPPRSPSPSLPSSDEDTLKRNASKKSNATHTPTTSISASAGGRNSMQSINKGKEAEIDARFLAMERKNAVLEAALLAVLQTTAGFGQGNSSQQRSSTVSSQARWSGASSVQQGPSPLESLIQTMATATQRE
ncbi:MAG: hypothetical protein M1814_004691 [Vezdaea aestivalis]|nr:MAG: hypothetical protein M1814_004691 [Vezdaea aestivalis]